MGYVRFIYFLMPGLIGGMTGLRWAIAADPQTFSLPCGHAPFASCDLVKTWIRDGVSDAQNGTVVGFLPIIKSDILSIRNTGRLPFGSSGAIPTAQQQAADQRNVKKEQLFVTNSEVVSQTSLCVPVKLPELDCHDDNPPLPGVCGPPDAALAKIVFLTDANLSGGTPAYQSAMHCGSGQDAVPYVSDLRTNPKVFELSHRAGLIAVALSDAKNIFLREITNNKFIIPDSADCTVFGQDILASINKINSLPGIEGLRECSITTDANGNKVNSDISNDCMTRNTLTAALNLVYSSTASFLACKTRDEGLRNFRISVQNGFFQYLEARMEECVRTGSSSVPNNGSEQYIVDTTLQTGAQVGGSAVLGPVGYGVGAVAGKAASSVTDVFINAPSSGELRVNRNNSATNCYNAGYLNFVRAFAAQTFTHLGSGCSTSSGSRGP